MKNLIFKLLAALLLSNSFLFALVDFNSATKEELVNIKGIGEKKALSIMEYRKTHKIKSVDDLKNIKGFGDKLISKIKESSK